MLDDEARLAEYVRSVGREPRNLPADHPDKWQWDYRGTKIERESLMERLGFLVAQQEESLFTV